MYEILLFPQNRIISSNDSFIEIFQPIPMKLSLLYQINKYFVRYHNFSCLHYLHESKH